MQKLHGTPIRLLSLAAALSLTFQANTQSPGIPVINESVPQPFNDYPLTADSQPQPNVPHGKTFKFEWNNSTVFPGTTRTITVYVPAQYKADMPACTFLFLDGIGYKAETVFDNLIAQHDMPITIAIGISPGTVASASGLAASDDPRYDRSFEFDSLTDRFSQLLLQEILPAVQQHQTPDGQPIHLSANPDDRAIGGGSTGGIGAFTVAWRHPEAFHRVFTSIGTFVGMRGGEAYYVQVRKSEPRPLRIFMEDGVNDEWAGAEMGDWWMSNQTMNRALTFAGYDVRHEWGAGTHNGGHATAIFPEAVRWLWRDYPRPIQAMPSTNRNLKAILQPNEGWHLLADNCPQRQDLIADTTGGILFPDGSRLTADVPNQHCPASTNLQPSAFGPDGKLYLAGARGGIEVVFPGNVKTKPYAEAQHLNIAYFTVRSNGDIYALTEPRNARNDLWFIPANGQPRKLDSNLKNAAGIAFTPDALWLFVAQSDSRFGLSYRVRTDGSLDSREPFYDFYLAPGADESDAAQIAMDTAGRPYVATNLGIQIFDRNGRVGAILPLPENAIPTGIAFGGPNFDILFVAAGGRIYTRKLQVKGAQPSAKPMKLPPWGAG